MYVNEIEINRFYVRMKVNIGNDQEMAQSERKCHSKTLGGMQQLNLHSSTYSEKT